MKLNDESRPFIDINLSDHLGYYERYIDLINTVANDSKYTRLLPMLNRNLLENLLRDIFSSCLEGEYTYLYYNQNRGQIRNLSTLFDVFKKLRKSFGESYAMNIPDEIIGYLDKFRKDGNISSHEIETYVDSNYANGIKEKFSATLHVLLQLHQKIINSGKKIKKIDEKLVKGQAEDKKPKSKDTSKIVRLISSIRNDIENIKDDEIIIPNKKEKIQERIDELSVNLTNLNINNSAYRKLILSISILENALHGDLRLEMKLGIELIAILFKQALLNENDVINNQKIAITILSICILILFFLLLFSFRF